MVPLLADRGLRSRTVCGERATSSVFRCFAICLASGHAANLDLDSSLVYPIRTSGPRLPQPVSSTDPTSRQGRTPHSSQRKPSGRRHSSAPPSTPAILMLPITANRPLGRRCMYVEPGSCAHHSSLSAEYRNHIFRGEALYLPDTSVCDIPLAEPPSPACLLDLN